VTLAYKKKGSFNRGIFNTLQCNVLIPWTCINDVDSSTVAAWNHIFVDSGVDASLTKLKHRLTTSEAKREIVKHAKLVSLVREEVNYITSNLTQSHLFILTDQIGMTLNLYGTEAIMETLESVNLGTGTSFALEHTGINGISMAMQLEETVVVQGKEHHLQLFSGWGCICMPIRVGVEIKAYLDLSFKADMDVTFAVPLLEQVVRRVECQLANNCPEVKRAQVYALFDQYQLTCREKEIGFLWLSNETVEDIASKLHISIGTVRTVFKRVYKKSKVCNKGEFIIKFFV
jgi:transcriptional regulator of acetoin/glycerol metabolism